MGSWARAGRGCTLHSGGCTARGLGPASIEVLSGGRREEVDTEKESVQQIRSLRHVSLVWKRSTVLWGSKHEHQPFQNTLDG